MKTEDTIKKVLALFDKEDIPYIKIQVVKNITASEEKVKKIGDRNDRYPKR